MFLILQKKSPVLAIADHSSHHGCLGCTKQVKWFKMAKLFQQISKSKIQRQSLVKMWYFISWWMKFKLEIFMLVRLPFETPKPFVACHATPADRLDSWSSLWLQIIFQTKTRNHVEHKWNSMATPTRGSQLPALFAGLVASRSQFWKTKTKRSSKKHAFGHALLNGLRNSLNFFALQAPSCLNSLLGQFSEDENGRNSIFLYLPNLLLAVAWTPWHSRHGFRSWTW